MSLTFKIRSVAEGCLILPSHNSVLFYKHQFFPRLVLENKLDTTQTKLELTSPNPKELHQSIKLEKILSFEELIKLSLDDLKLNQRNIKLLLVQTY